MIKNKKPSKLEKLIMRLERDIPRYNDLKDSNFDGLLRKNLNRVKNLERRSNRDKEVTICKYDDLVVLYMKSVESIYNELKEEFKLKENFESLEDRDFILKRGLKRYLKENKILQRAYMEEFSREIPKNPKDEHPEARKLNRRFIIHAGPTNSGKTYQSIERLKNASSGMYLAPLRLLALEVYETINKSGVPCDLLTGEEQIKVPFSKHYSSTIEKADYSQEYDVVVIDEGQFISDDQRGNSWLRAVLGVRAKEIHICCSLNALDLLEKIITGCGDRIEVVEHERYTPLIVEDEEFKFPKNVQVGDAIVCFSRKKVLSVAAELRSKGIKSSVIYGMLPPETRKKQVELFLDGKTDVVVATDSIGMGLNLPIRRVVFLQTTKYDGEKERELSGQEVKQIAGRAGRKGLHPKGFVNTMTGKSFVKRRLGEKDVRYTKATIEPLENTIVNLEFGTIDEKLRHWKSFKYDVDYLKKADIKDRLYLYSKIPEKVQEGLTERQAYRAIHIPFDHQNVILMERWVNYLVELRNDTEALPKPEIKIEQDLKGLETLYREIELFYSFSNAFGLDYDEQWVSENRMDISLRIHKNLVDEMDLQINVCTSCGEKLFWDYVHDLCDYCYTTRKHYYVN